MTRAPWHSLLAPLPPDARPQRRAVASPELVAAGAADAVAGWEDLVVELSAGPAGLRIAQVLVDGGGTLLSASDHVLLRDPSPTPPLVHHDSIGGRFEPDGRFNGTCWAVDGPEPPDDAAPDWRMVSRTPTDAEVTALRTLVADILRRGGVGRHDTGS